MDTIYSTSLLVSLGCGGLALLLAIRFRLAAQPVAARRIPAVLLTIAFAALLVSFVVHLIWGHGRGTPDALAFADFLRIHPSFLTAVALPFIALFLLRGKRDD